MKTKDFEGTSGKWGIDPYDKTIVIADIQYNGQIAECNNPDKHCNHLAYISDGTHFNNEKEVAEANAKLIAAAPEMLKVLQDIVEGLYPSTAEEAFIFVDIAKKMAIEVIEKALK